MASHMDGLNSLPRWDPSNPTTYSYNPQNYNPSDYAAFKEARQAFGKQQSKATAERNKQIFKEANKAINDKLKEELQPKTKAASRNQVKEWAKAGHTLYADIPSSCFEELKFIPDKDDPTTGTVVGTFYRGGAITYDGPLDLDDFLDATSGDSLGEWYNDTKPF